MSKARDLADLISTGGILADGAVSVSEISDLTATAAELNTLDGITASTADLNNVTNINTNVQTQLDLKAPLASPTFTGTVTIGGTTYPTSDGTEGQVLTTNGSGAVSFSDPAGGGSADFVASGSIANGDVVALNSDGTVSVVSSAAIPTPSVGSAVTFTSSNNDHPAAVFDSSNNKIVIAYVDSGNSNQGTAVVGTVSGDSISFGTPVVFETGATDEISIAFDSFNNKVVIAYQDEGNSDYGTAVVGTVSGDSISFGTPVVFESATVNMLRGNCTVFDSSNNKIVITYRDVGNSSYGTAIVGTVSGTSISFGTPVVFYSGTLSGGSSNAFDSSNNKVVVTFRAVSNSSVGYAVVGTVSGTSISFGSPNTFATGPVDGTRPIFDSNSNKMVIAYHDNGNSSYGTAVVGTVSGTSMTFGTPVVYNAADTRHQGGVFDSLTNKVIITYFDTGNSNYGTAIVGTVSGTSISFSSEYVINQAYSQNLNPAFDTVNNKTVIPFRHTISPVAGKAVVFSTASTNASSYIGVASEAISDTATGKITIDGGINEGQTGLTIGTTYFVADNGSLSTTNNGRKIGKAISATKILVNSNMSGDEMDDYLGSLV